MSNEWSHDSLFDLVGDEITRDILERTSTEPTSADDLADRIDVSLPTVYRRLNALAEFELLEETIHVDDDGNHYKRFVTPLVAVTMRLDRGTWSVDVDRRSDIGERPSSHWGDLDGAGETGVSATEPDQQPSRRTDTDTE